MIRNINYGDSEEQEQVVDEESSLEDNQATDPETVQEGSTTPSTHS